MSQAKKLPEQIIADTIKMTHFWHPLENQKETKDRVKEVTDYANEVAVTAIILSDNWMKQLYDYCGQGYMFCIDELRSWATEFVAKFAHVEEWEEFIYSDANPYKGTMCWDDVVIAFGEQKFNEFKK